jgi:hypothetical protein
MWKTLTTIIGSVKGIVKYAGLAIVIVTILSFAAEKLEEWQKANQPTAKK